MPEQNSIPPVGKPQPAAPLGLKLRRWRPWVQALSLAVWAAPLGRWLHGLPGCVFHCYSCPLSSFACPIGVAANYAALFPAVFEIPYLLLGVLLLTGGLVGSLICGWTCPFGFIQDLLGRLRTRKITIPNWLGYTRFAVLLGLVIALPMYWGAQGIAFEEQSVSICRLCPAGALEAGLPYSISSLISGKGWLMSGFKTGILAVFVLSAIFIHRPWCRIFCPLGGLLALFNRVSLFHLRFKAQECSQCNLCRSRCPAGVHVDKKVNVSGCLRCLECTTCGAITPAFSRPTQSQHPPPAPAPDAR